MKKLYFFCTCLFSFLSIINATGSEKQDCLEKEKAIAFLESAESILGKAKGYYLSCDSKYIVVEKKNESKEVVKDEKYGDCSEIFASGRKESGVYTIWPINFPTQKPLKVYCDMETDGEGWTVIQRRGKYPIQRDFNKNWDSYKIGFGDLTEEFWLGNEDIRLLCLKGCKIRFDLIDYKGVYYFAVYHHFSLSTGYRIDISGYSGNATDAISKHNNNEFSTKDRVVGGYAAAYHSGWWHGKNYYCNLNGVYEPGQRGTKYVYWWKEPNDYINLSSVEMKVKPD